MWRNPSDDEIRQRLLACRSIAVVGLSPKADRPSHRVSQRMQQWGKQIIPVRPATASVLGETAYPSLAALPVKVDLVDVFRRSAEVAALVDDCIRLGLPALWLQQGVIDEAAAERARAAGVWVVMDRCLLVEYARLCL